MRAVRQQTARRSIGDRFARLALSRLVFLVRLDDFGSGCDRGSASLEEEVVQPDGWERWQIQVEEDQGESQRSNPGAWSNCYAEQRYVVVHGQKRRHGIRGVREGCDCEPAAVIRLFRQAVCQRKPVAGELMVGSLAAVSILRLLDGRCGMYGKNRLRPGTIAPGLSRREWLKIPRRPQRGL